MSSGHRGLPAGMPRVSRKQSMVRWTIGPANGYARDGVPWTAKRSRNAKRGQACLGLRAKQDCAAMKVLSRGPRCDAIRPQLEARNKFSQPLNA